MWWVSEDWVAGNSHQRRLSNAGEVTREGECEARQSLGPGGFAWAIMVGSPRGTVAAKSAS